MELIRWLSLFIVPCFAMPEDYQRAARFLQMPVQEWRPILQAA